MSTAANFLSAPGLLTGEGFFTTVACYRGQLFAWQLHLQRLNSSLLAFGFQPLQAPACVSAWQQLREVLWGQNWSQNAPPVCRLRLTVWRTGAGSQTYSLLLLTAPQAPVLGAVNGSCARLVTSQIRRNETDPLVNHKSISYASNSVALRAASAAGGTEAALFNTRAELAEGTFSNIIVDLGGTLVTPPLAAGCLPGVTRQLALTWARQAALPCREASAGELTREQIIKLRPAAALLGTMRNVQQVSHWDNTPLKSSPVLLELAELFAAKQHTALEALP